MKRQKKKKKALFSEFGKFSRFNACSQALLSRIWFPFYKSCVTVSDSSAAAHNVVLFGFAHWLQHHSSSAQSWPPSTAPFINHLLSTSLFLFQPPSSSVSFVSLFLSAPWISCCCYSLSIYLSLHPSIFISLLTGKLPIFVHSQCCRGASLPLPSVIFPFWNFLPDFLILYEFVLWE